ncbi:MAG: hypothetical protein Q7S96_04345 [bacterium]|nr:hypothetical protein [bacterium]
MDPILVGALLLLPIVGTFSYGALSAAPWVPMHARDVARFHRMAQLRPGERFYDLGCGDGRLVRAAAAAGAHATGFEVSLLPYLIARIRGRRRGVVRYRDFWRQDLSDADVIYVFLMPKVYRTLRRKLERECRPGTRVILYVWPMDGWQHDLVDTSAGSPKLYRYTL